MAVSAVSASVEACGGTVTEFQSRITSPGYPSFYENDLDCTWNIDLGDVFGFTIVKNHFDVEEVINCGHDYLKIVDGNGYEQNFCHSPTDYSASEDQDDPCPGPSSYWESWYRKRRSADVLKESDKYTPDLVNVSNTKFPDRTFIAGGSATIRFVSDECLRYSGFDLIIEEPNSSDFRNNRFEMIEFHARVSSPS